MRIGKIVSSAEFRMDEQFQNFQFLEPNFDFPNWKKSRDFLFFQFRQFQILQTSKIKKKIQKKIQSGNCRTFSLLKILEIVDLENSKGPIREIPQIFNLQK